MKRRAILLSMAFAAGAAPAPAQPAETLLNAADAVESDVGLGLFGSRGVQARVVYAWAELRRFGIEQQHRLSTLAQDLDGVTLANPREATDFTPGFAPPTANGLWPFKQFKFWQKDLFKQER